MNYSVYSVLNRYRSFNSVPQCFTFSTFNKLNHASGFLINCVKQKPTSTVSLVQVQKFMVN